MQELRPQFNPCKGVRVHLLRYAIVGFLVVLLAGCSSQPARTVRSSASPTSTCKPSHHYAGDITVTLKGDNGYCAVLSLQEILATAWRLYKVQPRKLTIVGKAEHFDCPYGNRDPLSGNGDTTDASDVCNDGRFVVTVKTINDALNAFSYYLVVYWQYFATGAAEAIFPTNYRAQQCAGGYVAAHMPNFSNSDLTVLRSTSLNNESIWPYVWPGIQAAQHGLSVMQGCSGVAALPTATGTAAAA